MFNFDNLDKNQRKLHSELDKLQEFLDRRSLGSGEDYYK